MGWYKTALDEDGHAIWRCLETSSNASRGGICEWTVN